MKEARHVCGQATICCGRTLGVLSCRGDFGRLGHGDIIDVFLPKPVRGLSGIGVTRLSCGDTHTLAMTREGRVFSFGRNQNGQLGIGTDADSLLPVPVEALKVLLLTISIHPPQQVEINQVRPPRLDLNCDEC